MTILGYNSSDIVTRRQKIKDGRDKEYSKFAASKTLCFIQLLIVGMKYLSFSYFHRAISIS